MLLELADPCCCTFGNLHASYCKSFTEGTYNKPDHRNFELCKNQRTVPQNQRIRAEFGEKKLISKKVPFGGIRFRKILTRDIFAKKFYLTSLGRGWVAEQHFMEALRLRENTLRWLSFRPKKVVDVWPSKELQRIVLT